MTLADQYTKETGQPVYVDLLGSACMTVEYVQWLETKNTELKTWKDAVIKHVRDNDWGCSKLIHHCPPGRNCGECFDRFIEVKIKEGQDG